MTFLQAIQTGFRKYADFTGTAPRSEFWWWALFTVLAGAALSALPVPAYQLADGTITLAPAFTPFWKIAILLPTLAITVRRLRDAGIGWGHLFWPLIPVAGLVVLVVLCAQPSNTSSSTAAVPAPQT